MAPNIWRKTAGQSGRLLLRSFGKEIRRSPRWPSKWCRPEDKEAKQSLAKDQVLRPRTYLNQPRIISHVKHATPSGTIPTSRFFPSHGNATTSRLAILLKSPLAKIQPECKPIGIQSDRVRIRASARIQPIRNNVLNPATTKIGSAN